MPRDKSGIYKLNRKSRNRKYMKIFLLLYILPIRIEFEIKIFGRKFFEEELDKIYIRYSNDILSCLILTFINGFSIYYNIYRFIIGVY